MKPFVWDPGKNKKLIQERGLSFEAILWHIQMGGVLEVLEHPAKDKYPGQRVFVVKAFGYVFLVPFEEGPDAIRLITVIPSRKAVRKYLGKGGKDES